MLRCEACGARVTTLRRGRCSICYLRWSDSRQVGAGASCVVCAERRRDLLRLVEYQCAWLPMCHNCSGRAFKLHPMPSSIEGLRQRLARDQRWSDRRDGKEDSRILRKDRRAGERRAAYCISGDEWIDAEDLIIEIVDTTEPFAAEATRIAKRSVDS